MDEDRQQKSAPKRESDWGWKGFGKDPTHQTTLFVVFAALNYFLALYAISEMGVKNAEGKFDFSGEMPLSFFVMAGITVISCGLTAPLIRYGDTATKWSARFFACGLPPLFFALLWLNWHK